MIKSEGGAKERKSEDFEVEMTENGRLGLS